MNFFESHSGDSAYTTRISSMYLPCSEILLVFVIYRLHPLLLHPCTRPIVIAGEIGSPIGIPSLCRINLSPGILTIALSKPATQPHSQKHRGLSFALQASIRFKRTQEARKVARTMLALVSTPTVALSYSCAPFTARASTTAPRGRPTVCLFGNKDLRKGPTDRQLSAFALATKQGRPVESAVGQR